jgi:RecQ zinc-binding
LDELEETDCPPLARLCTATRISKPPSMSSKLPYVHIIRKNFRFFLRDISNPVYKSHKEDMMSEMMKYLESSVLCRRQVLLTHFEGKSVKLEPTKECCDNCIKE